MFELLALAEASPTDSSWVRRALRLVPDVPPDSDRDAYLAEIAEAEPSAETLAELAAYDPTQLVAHDRVLLVRAWERHAGWLASRQQQAIVAVTGAAPTDPADEDFAKLEIATALRLSPGSASRRVDAARQLTGRLSATGRAVETGEITFWYALSVVEAVAALDDDQAAQVERAVLDGAGTLSIAAFRARLRRAVIAAAPKSADERHAAAAADRRVVLDPRPDGMAWLSAYLTAPEAIAAYRALDDRARAAAGQPSAYGEHLSVGADPVTGAQVDVGDRDTRSATTDPIAVRRADAFVAAIVGISDYRSESSDAETDAGAGPARRQAGEPTQSGGLSTNVLITMDLPTALRLADNPAFLDGYGEIPPELARQFAADGRWQRLLIEPATGHLLDYGRTTYRPPDALADYVRARDVTCRFPGCCRIAMRCDLDHAESWQCEGGTCSANLGALCRRHHRAKTHAGWQLESHPDGSADWTSPTGHRHRRPAINHAPEHVAHIGQRPAEAQAEAQAHSAAAARADSEQAGEVGTGRTDPDLSRPDRAA